MSNDNRDEEAQRAEDTETSLAIWQHDEQGRKVRLRIAQISILGVGLLIFISQIYNMGQSFKWWGKMPITWQVSLGLLQIFAVLVYLSRTIVTRSQKSVLRNLIRSEDIRAVVPLADALEFNNRNVPEVVQALIRLLPRLQEDDGHLLNTDQRANLYRALSEKNSFSRVHVSQLPKLQLAILQALEKIGDTGGLADIEALIKGFGSTHFNRDVRSAAQAYLPVLRERSEQAQIQGMLLRSSALPTSSPSSLLRPATDSGHQESTLLVRPGASPDNDTSPPGR
jgi:hypothetical protein